MELSAQRLRHACLAPSNRGVWVSTVLNSTGSAGLSHTHVVGSQPQAATNQACCLACLRQQHHPPSHTPPYLRRRDRESIHRTTPKPFSRMYRLCMIHTAHDPHARQARLTCRRLLVSNSCVCHPYGRRLPHDPASPPALHHRPQVTGVRVLFSAVCMLWVCS